MQYISPLKNHSSSVSLRCPSYRRLAAARTLLSRNGLFLSEQDLYRSLLKLFLHHWRGRGRKTGRPRRYNQTGCDYVIRPLYINQVLYAALWQRALHSGESVSRMLDFALRFYLPRLMEELLSGARSSNAPYWNRRRLARRHSRGDFFINYECKTRINVCGNLEYVQEARIIPKNGLSPWQILTCLQTAA